MNKTSGKPVFSKVVKKSDNLPWIVMIHGFTGNHTIFESQIKKFKEQSEKVFVSNLN